MERVALYQVIVTVDQLQQLATLVADMATEQTNLEAIQLALSNAKDMGSVIIGGVVT